VQCDPRVVEAYLGGCAPTDAESAH
jgi:hypothetical protein